MKDIKHKVYLKMCRELAALSKCKKVKVACMLVNNGRIISTGVNGTPSGHINCCEHFKDHNHDELIRDHSNWSLKNEIHAEMAALLYAAKTNVEITPDTVLYCTHEPCDNCLKHIAGVKIKYIFYIDKYYNNLDYDNIFDLNIEQIKID